MIEFQSMTLICKTNLATLHCSARGLYSYVIWCNAKFLDACCVYCNDNLRWWLIVDSLTPSLIPTVCPIRLGLRSSSPPNVSEKRCVHYLLWTLNFPHLLRWDLHSNASNNAAGWHEVFGRQWLLDRPLQKPLKRVGLWRWFGPTDYDWFGLLVWGVRSAVVNWLSCTCPCRVFSKIGSQCLVTWHVATYHIDMSDLPHMSGKMKTTMSCRKDMSRHVAWHVQLSQLAWSRSRPSASRWRAALTWLVSEVVSMVFSCFRRNGWRCQKMKILTKEFIATLYEWSLWAVI